MKKTFECICEQITGQPPVCEGTCNDCQYGIEKEYLDYARYSFSLYPIPKNPKNIKEIDV